MSISVFSNSSFNVASIGYSFTGNAATQQKTNIYLIPNPVNSTLYRVSLYISAAASDAGQSAILTAYAIDANGIENKVATAPVAPGQTAQVVGVLSAIAGGAIQFSILPNGTDIITNNNHYSMAIENV